MIKFNRKGFTLIELLVVIAIIGILSTMAVVALGSARKKARDAKRQSDLKVLQTAIEMYVSDNGSVPVLTEADAWDGAAVAGNYSLEERLSPYLPGGLPEDPSSAARDWMYCYNSTHGTYMVGLTLEVEKDPLSGDLDTLAGESNWAVGECVASDDGGDVNAIPNCSDTATIGLIDDLNGTAVCLGSNDS